MKLNITYESLSKILDGKLTAEKPFSVLEKLSIDSRTLQKGEAYLVIKGQKHDGHKFIKAAIEKGASLIIAEEGRGEEAKAAGVALLEVKDTLKALQGLALHHRLKHNIKIAAVTGSNGKSTTKQMLLAICQRAGKTCNTKGNFNNQIGVPLSILEITEEDKYGVFELGASHKGDIDEIASIVRPDVAIITNVSPAHLEFFGDMETVYQTKTEIINSINSYGTLIYNNDDSMLRRLKTRYDGRSLSFGFSADADLRIIPGEKFSFGYKGAIFENLIADVFGKMGRKLYYFHKDSGLEVDFVIRYKGQCTLVEVKASTGNTKSTRTILRHPEKYHVSQAIKLGDYNVGRTEQLLTLPLYMAFLLKEL